MVVSHAEMTLDISPETIGCMVEEVVGTPIGEKHRQADAAMLQHLAQDMAGLRHPVVCGSNPHYDAREGKFRGHKLWILFR
jgi:hypothetical protein